MADETLRRVELAHRYANLGDVRLHYVKAGEGPLVLLLHGFPQLWYQWRHQIPALVKAGFRVVTPSSSPRTGCTTSFAARWSGQEIGSASLRDQPPRGR